MIVRPSDVEEFTTHVLGRDRDAAVGQALRLLDQGVPATEILIHLVGGAQLEVGERWHANRISVADEHAATAVADSVVGVLNAQPEVGTATGPRLVVACAEGEWHVLPARLTADVLRLAGCDVTFLGGSLPPAHLGRFLEGDRPDLLAISVSTALAFEGAALCAEVARVAGVPTLMGGRALGPDDRRARVLGADLWAADASAAVELVGAPLPPAGAEATADIGTTMALAVRRSPIVEHAADQLARSFPDLGRYDDAQRARTREDLDYIMRFAEASILVRDPRVFEEFLAWLATLLHVRGVAPSALPLSLAALRDAAPEVELLVSAAR